MVVTYYIKLFRTGTDRYNGILMSLLLLVAETNSFFIMQRDYNGYNYHTSSAKIYFSLITVVKSKKKKLAVTSLYCLGQETWMIHENVFT